MTSLPGLPCVVGRIDARQVELRQDGVNVEPLVDQYRIELALKRLVLAAHAHRNRVSHRHSAIYCWLNWRDPQGRCLQGGEIAAERTPGDPYVNLATRDCLDQMRGRADLAIVSVQ